jgi:uncharacterized protein
MRLLFLSLGLAALLVPLHGQDLSRDVAALALRGSREATVHQHRGFTLPERTMSRYNPLVYAGAALLYVYQNVISDQLQANCMYEISCSEYARRSIRRYGLFSGMLRGFSQLSECFNGAVYEHPRLFVNGDRKIINPVEGAAD